MKIAFLFFAIILSFEALSVEPTIKKCSMAKPKVLKQKVTKK